MKIDLTIRPDTQFATAYDPDTGKPLATAIRRRVYAKGPAWRVYLVNSDSVLFTAESGFAVRRNLRLHFQAEAAIAAKPACPSLARLETQGIAAEKIGPAGAIR